jgi:hypothetical protein
VIVRGYDDSVDISVLEQAAIVAVDLPPGAAFGCGLLGAFAIAIRHGCDLCGLRQLIDEEIAAQSPVPITPRRMRSLAPRTRLKGSATVAARWRRDVGPGFNALHVSTPAGAGGGSFVTGDYFLGSWGTGGSAFRLSGKTWIILDMRRKREG